MEELHQFLEISNWIWVVLVLLLVGIYLFINITNWIAKKLFGKNKPPRKTNQFKKQS